MRGERVRTNEGAMTALVSSVTVATPGDGFGFMLRKVIRRRKGGQDQKCAVADIFELASVVSRKKPLLPYHTHCLKRGGARLAESD